MQLVHWWQTVLPFNHLSTLPNHVDHQAVEQLTSCYLHQTQGKLDVNCSLFFLPSYLSCVNYNQMIASNSFCEQPLKGETLPYEMTYFSVSVTGGQSQLTNSRQKWVEVDDWLHISERHCKAEPFLRIPGNKFLHHLF